MKAKSSFFFDALTSVLCAAGFCLCFLFFWKDLNAAFSRTGEQPVGIITFRYNTAQRRFIDRVLWDRLRNDSPVYNGDVIRTADLSEATITFSGGDIVDLTSNTLIQIFADKDASRIDFSGGEISVNASSAMVIASGNKLLTVDAGAVLQASALKNGAFDIAVSEGTAVLENSDRKKAKAQGTAESRVIAAGDSLLLNAEGEAQAVPRATAVFPPPGARFLSQTNEGLNLEFSWNKINYQPDGLTRLEVARDRSFNRTLFAGNSSDSRISLTLPEGTWFWRLYPLSEGASEIPYSKITVVSNPIPSLISPQEGQVFSYRNRLPSLRFQWTSSQSASSYILEVADNPSLQNPALNITVRSGTGDQLSFISSALGDGTWYWKVTPVYSRDFSGNPSVSRTGSFAIKRGAELSAPVLTAPADEAVFNIETGRRDILFSWKKENEAASYTLTISANKDMSSPIIVKTTADTFYRYGADETSITSGTWYWTVRQTDSNGDASPTSQPRSFTALRGEIIQSPIFPPDNYVVADNLLPNTRFTWKTNLTDTYFQISNNADFTSVIIDESAPGDAYTVYSLKAGVYYWRITGGPDTQRLYSKHNRFTVVESLPPPELSQPKSGALTAQSGKITIREGQPVDFSWKSSDADYYTFKLYRSGSANPVMETTVFDTKLDVNMDALGEGSYTWTVQGFAREKSSSSRRTGLASTGSINIRHLRPAILEFPRYGWEYSGIDASRKPGAVRWSSRETPVNVRFVIATDERMTNIIYMQANVPREVPLPRLSAGNYYWTIQAETVDGYDISAAAPFRFRVLPIPLLPVPQNRLPVNSTMIGAEQIMASRKVAFSWDATQGANGYILTIFQGSGVTRKTVLQTPVINENAYAVDDIQLLGRGEFLWQVEAVYVMDDDFIEQRGRVQENKFTVNIPVPSQVNTMNSGVLYGK
ncbi:hypothetical protein R84B8_02434 [Treponema sp. R8-4-B8]